MMFGWEARTSCGPLEIIRLRAVALLEFLSAPAPARIVPADLRLLTPHCSDWRIVATDAGRARRAGRRTHRHTPPGSRRSSIADKRGGSRRTRIVVTQLLRARRNGSSRSNRFDALVAF